MLPTNLLYTGLSRHSNLWSRVATYGCNILEEMFAAGKETQREKEAQLNKKNVLWAKTETFPVLFFLLCEIYLRVSVHLCCAICVVLPFQLRCNDGNKQSGKMASARTKRTGTNVRMCGRKYC